MQRFDLRTQIVRHRRSVRFVMFKQLVAEGLALGIKHHSSMRRLVLKDQASEHIQHTVHRTGWFTGAVSQRRKRMVSAIKVRRAVNKDKWVFWDLNHDVRACLLNYG